MVTLSPLEYASHTLRVVKSHLDESSMSISRDHSFSGGNVVIKHQKSIYSLINSLIVFDLGVDKLESVYHSISDQKRFNEFKKRYIDTGVFGIDVVTTINTIKATYDKYDSKSDAYFKENWNIIKSELKQNQHLVETFYNEVKQYLEEHHPLKA